MGTMTSTTMMTLTPIIHLQCLMNQIRTLATNKTKMWMEQLMGMTLTPFHDSVCSLCVFLCSLSVVSLHIYSTLCVCPGQSYYVIRCFLLSFSARVFVIF